MSGSKLEVRDVPGKGRGVFASAPIAAGEVVVNDMPIMLYPMESFRRSVCSFCLRALALAGAAVVPCDGCQQAAFCSPACAAAAAADPASHTPLVCRCLTTCNLAGLTDEQQSSLHFLLRATSLKAAAAAGDAAAAARFSALTSLAGAAAELEVEARELHGRLAHALAAAGSAAAGLSLQEAADLLRKDGINGYGIMAPSGPEGERQIRGTGLYPTAALINHECLPNLARFDCFDAPLDGGAAAAAGGNTGLQLRALHAIPQGEELTQSYFPLTWTYKERQQRCQEQYGFSCTCPRCKEECTWPSDEEEDGSSDEWMTDDGEGEEEQEATGAAADGPTGATAEPQADPAYINLFLLKYVCPREDCMGTLAPVAANDNTDTPFECNMCGLRRTEADFLEELQATAE